MFINVSAEQSLWLNKVNFNENMDVKDNGLKQFVAVVIFLCL
jgi:hypothetical protein